MMRQIKHEYHLEEVINKILGLKKTKNSGAVHNDGDGKGGKIEGSTYNALLVDAKFSAKKKASVSFKKEDWWKTVASARRHGRIPAMGLFNPDIETPPAGEVFVVMSLDDFARLYSLANERYKEIAIEL